MRGEKTQKGQSPGKGDFKVEGGPTRVGSRGSSVGGAWSPPRQDCAHRLPHVCSATSPPPDDGSADKDLDQEAIFRGPGHHHPIGVCWNVARVCPSWTASLETPGDADS